MKSATQIKKEEDRKRRRADERWRRYIQDLRRRHMQAERDRRRRWLLALLLWALESTPVQMFFPMPDPAPVPPPPPKTSPARKSEKKAPVEAVSDYDRHYLFDHRPRRGEEHLEVYDGLTYRDIDELNRIHRPHLFPKFTPIPGMPKQYADEPVNVLALFDHMSSDYHRSDAIKALKLIVAPESHAWIDACATETNGLTWKDLRRQCRRRTPEMTTREFPRAAERWREELRREAEERKREANETPLIV
jgi:hypothetical protein